MQLQELRDVNLNFKLPKLTKAKARRKISLEINFVYLGNKEIYRIF
jgi:hypothetical protein